MKSKSIAVSPNEAKVCIPRPHELSRIDDEKKLVQDTILLPKFVFEHRIIVTYFRWLARSNVLDRRMQDASVLAAQF